MLFIALEAANAVLKLPPSQIKMMSISKTARAEVMKEYGEKIKEVAKQAAEEVIKKALKEGHKTGGSNKTEASISIAIPTIQAQCKV